MRLQYQINGGPGYLIAKVTGEWELASVEELIDALAGDCRALNCDKLLVDCLDVSIAGRVLEFERFVAGQRVASKMRHIKLAALFPDHQINKFAESIAVEAGAEFLVTGDRDEAMCWLRGDAAG